MIKKENILIPMVIILKKIISFEKLVIPRLRVFEEICPSSIEWKVILYIWIFVILLIIIKIYDLV